MNLSFTGRLCAAVAFLCVFLASIQPASAQLPDNATPGQTAAGEKNWEVIVTDPQLKLEPGRRGGKYPTAWDLVDVPTQSDSRWASIPDGRSNFSNGWKALEVESDDINWENHRLQFFRSKGVTLNLDGQSFDLPKVDCATEVQYTYFQTTVNIPEGATNFLSDWYVGIVDDAVRILVYNDDHPNGAIVGTRTYGEWNRLIGSGGHLLRTGDNRIVVIYLEDCDRGSIDLKPRNVYTYLDSDSDGSPDGIDNCPDIANADQADLDGDEAGDVCDDDRDGDGVDNDADIFPDDGSEWADNDGDGTGDNADPDDDNDGVLDEIDSDPFNPDVDGDSILDGADFCAVTNLTDNVGWGTNHWRLSDDGFNFEQKDNKGKGKGSGRGNNTEYTLATTGGCTCEQIIVELDLGDGHTKHGCSNSAMEEWAARVANGDVTVPVSGKTSFDFAISEINEMDPYLSEVPTEVTLEGNYPNPFNPQTTIRFGLPETAEVSLVVYDMMGREVKVLVNGTLNAGMHEASFDASSLPSGAYMYRLTTPGQEFSKLMMLLK